MLLGGGVAFEWDDDKNKTNLKKHGISFETATRVFSDPFAVQEQERFEDGEARWQTTGIASGVSVLVVAHAFRDRDNVEVIRIISARRALRLERKRYEEAKYRQIRI